LPFVKTLLNLIVYIRRYWEHDIETARNLTSKKF